MTALHWATEHNHQDVVELLIKYGADVHAFSKFDKSAFDIALDKNNPETLVMLQVGEGRILLPACSTGQSNKNKYFLQKFLFDIL